MPTWQTGLALAALSALVITVAWTWQVRRRKTRDTYLIAPYLDLDEPGDRGTYYAMSGQGPARAR